jgi:hypothetical protein
MMIIDVPVASYSEPSRIRDWIRQLELAREDKDAEPFDLMVIEDYLEMARGWLESARPVAATDNLVIQVAKP